MGQTTASEVSSALLERLLASHVSLEPRHLAVIRRGLGAVKFHMPNVTPIQVPHGPRRAMLLIEGWAAAVAHLHDGRRQIVSLFLPGDVVDSMFDLQDGVQAEALTPTRAVAVDALVETLTLPGAELAPLVQAWTQARADAQSRLVRHVIRLGRMSAYESTADLFLELHRRQLRTGQASAEEMPLPITQEIMADYLGLSAVHMNRTLQQLRRAGLLAHRPGGAAFPNLAALRATISGAITE